MSVYAFDGRAYYVMLQFRFISAAASFAVCSKRRPCASCYRKWAGRFPSRYWG